MQKILRHGTERKDISVVIPVYNEEECLPCLEKELLAVLYSYSYPWEIIFVDDGSSDQTPFLLRKIAEKEPRCRVLRFAKNCQQSAAFAAGFRAARGAITVTLDADLQNDPADIPLLLSYMAQYDCVCGWRKDRKDNWFRKIQSAIANRIRNWISGESIIDTGCSLKAFRTDLLQQIYLFKGAHRFLPTLMRMVGANVIEVPVNHRPRYAGKAKYGMWNRVFVATWDLFGVRWLKNRKLDYEIMDEYGNGLCAKDDK
ncbi:MAG: glycosyltransferase family 2 protein [Planctomycetota bacterium]|nr:glycosyltransferase family 2 protein [Planctomycetota bacterium]